jgi:hypothetical protein
LSSRYIPGESKDFKGNKAAPCPGEFPAQGGRKMGKEIITSANTEVVVRTART